MQGQSQLVAAQGTAASRLAADSSDGCFLGCCFPCDSSEHLQGPTGPLEICVPTPIIIQMLMGPDCCNCAMYCKKVWDAAGFPPAPPSSGQSERAVEP